MAAEHAELIRRVGELEERVRALEGRGSVVSPGGALPTRLVELRHERGASRESPAVLVSAIDRPAPTPVAAAELPVPSSLPPRPQATPVANKPGAPSSAATDTWAVERFIGGRFYAGLGAIVVVVGVGLFLKLAVQRGWLSFPPSARCLSAALFGALLLGAGELARRKIGAIASVGLSAAGIAALYASVLAAYGWYKLVDPVPALIMLAGVSGVGVVVALRANQLILALLVSAGAHLTPLVLWKADMAPAVLPIYLLAVLGFGLWVAGARPKPFGPVRFVVSLGTFVVGSLWAHDVADLHAPLVLGFFALAWAMVHAELAFAVVRSVGGPTESTKGTAPASSPLFARAVFASLGATLWATIGGVATVRESRAWIDPARDWLVPAVLGFAAAVLGVFLGRGLRALMRPARTDRERVSLLMLVQAGALLVTAMALGIDPSLQSACWLALGTGAAIGGAIVGSQAIAAYGLLLLAIAVGRLLFWDSWHLPPGSVNIAGIVATRWTGLMLAAAACIAATGAVIRRRSGTEGWRLTASACVGVAILLPMFGALTADSRGDSVAVWCALMCAAAWGIASLWRSTGLGVFAGMVTVSCVTLTAMGQMALAEESRFVELSGLIVTRWSLALILFSGAMVFGGLAAPRIWPAHARAVVGVLSAGAAAAMMLAPHLAGSSGGAVTLCWIFVAVAVLGVRAAFPRLPALGDIAGGILVLAATAWFAAYPMPGWNKTEAATLLHPGLWVAVLLCVIVALTHAWLRRSEVRSVSAAAFAAAAAWSVVGLVSFTASSFEIARTARILLPGDPTAQNGAVSIWWGLYAGVLLAVGFAHKAAAARHVGLGLLGLATAKAVLFDLRDVSPEWRVASFLGLGLLMLGVAVVYARVSRRMELATNG